VRLGSRAPRIRLEDRATAIRPFVASDLEELVALRVRNRAHTEPFEPLRRDDFYSTSGQAQEIALDERAWAAGTGFAFAILDVAAGDRIAGRIALSNVVRGPWRNANLGYWVDAAVGGRGHATTAARLILAFAFGEAGLHRVQPAIMPRNDRSRRVVEKAGFRLEGRAERYLQIAGAWEDHDIYAMTAEEFTPASRD
jgi:ribosomal-protein-alanine N-acetyltransferase